MNKFMELYNNTQRADSNLRKYLQLKINDLKNSKTNGIKDAVDIIERNLKMMNNVCISDMLFTFRYELILRKFPCSSIFLFDEKIVNEILEGVGY